MTEHDHTESGRQIRQIVIAMIVSKRLLARVAPVWTGSNFAARWVNVLGGWCIDYYQTYNKAPKKHVETLFAERSAELAPDDRKLVESCLVGLSNEYEQQSHELNPHYVADLASKHFVGVRQKKLSEDLVAAVRAKDTERAEMLINEYRHVQIGTGSEVDYFHDDAALEAALDPERAEKLITFPGPADEFFNNAFSRNCLVAFFGREGLGKSWMLQEVTWQAVQCRRKVAYFGIGDMTQEQVLNRFAVRTADCPTRPRVVQVPVSIQPVGKITSKVEYEEREFKVGLNFKKAKARRDFTYSELRVGGSPLKIKCVPSGTLSVQDLEATLDQWLGINWVPDVVVIDYADIMKTRKYSKEPREGINDLWCDLRRISGQRHNLIVTASQVNRASYKVQLLNMEHVSEEKRKLAHATSCFGLNQTKDEKRDGVVRVNRLKHRDDDYDPNRVCWIGGCLSVGNPVIVSAYPTRAEIGKMEDRSHDDD